jgi:hypothetical protein
MIKGGYKIIDFKGAALSGVAETLDGIYAQIVDEYDKPIMVSGVSLNGDIMDDAYAGVHEKVVGNLSKSVELTVYGGIITVTEDDEVSFVLSKTTAELTAEIGDLEDLETTEKDSVIKAINEVNMKSILRTDTINGTTTVTGNIQLNRNISDTIIVAAYSDSKFVITWVDGNGDWYAKILTISASMGPVTETPVSITIKYYDV